MAGKTTQERTRHATAVAMASAVHRDPRGAGPPTRRPGDSRTPGRRPAPRRRLRGHLPGGLAGWGWLGHLRPRRGGRVRRCRQPLHPRHRGGADQRRRPAGQPGAPVHSRRTRPRGVRKKHRGDGGDGRHAGRAGDRPRPGTTGIHPLRCRRRIRTHGPLSRCADERCHDWRPSGLPGNGSSPRDIRGPLCENDRRSGRRAIGTLVPACPEL